MPKHINASEFQEKVIKGGETALVDFYADWCGPCRMMGPVIEQAEREIPNCNFYKINVDEEGALAASFGISSIPTVIIFKGGKEVSKSIGLTDVDEIKKRFNEI